MTQTYDRDIGVTIAPAPESDITITFPPAGTTTGAAWITVDPNDGRPALSIGITRTDDGITIDVYAPEHEMGEPISTTTVADRRAIDATTAYPEGEEVPG